MKAKAVIHRQSWRFCQSNNKINEFFSPSTFAFDARSLTVAARRCSSGRKPHNIESSLPQLRTILGCTRRGRQEARDGPTLPMVPQGARAFWLAGLVLRWFYAVARSKHTTPHHPHDSGRTKRR